jgi:hypothetical protein
MSERFAGQEGALSLLNSTTGDQLMPDLAFESVEVSFPFEVVTKQYIGETGPDHREFSNGYEIKVKFAPTNADQLATIANAMIAKAQGKSNDEFMAQFKAASPDGGTLLITCRDIRWEGLPLNLAGRLEFLMGDLNGKGKKSKIESI